MTNKLKFNSTIQTILVTVFSFLFVTLISYAATTIGTSISTGGTLAVTGASTLTGDTSVGGALTITGLTTLANASTTQISASSNIYTALTANSIPYITTSGLLTQDNSNLVWDGTNNRMGIGTSSPYAKLSIHANNGETNTTLFNIASSTASATTSLFTVLNNGNVGVGTDAPSADLHLLTNATTGNGMYIDASTVTSGNGLLIEANSTNMTSVGSLLKLTVDGVAKVSFDKYGTGIFKNGIKVEKDSGVLGLGASSDAILYYDGSNLFIDPQNIGSGSTIFPAGKIGIGTTSPATLIDAYSTATTTITLDSSDATRGACLKLKNATTSGYTYCIANGGGLSCSATSCE